MVICLWQGADLHIAQLIALPLAVSCSRKSRLVWFYLYGTVSHHTWELPNFSRLAVEKINLARRWKKFKQVRNSFHK